MVPVDYRIPAGERRRARVARSLAEQRLRTEVPRYREECPRRPLELSPHEELARLMRENRSPL